MDFLNHVILHVFISYMKWFFLILYHNKLSSSTLFSSKFSHHFHELWYFQSWVQCCLLHLHLQEPLHLNTRFRRLQPHFISRLQVLPCFLAIAIKHPQKAIVFAVAFLVPFPQICRRKQHVFFCQFVLKLTWLVRCSTVMLQWFSQSLENLFNRMFSCEEYLP